MKFKKQWAPSDDVRVHHVERAGLVGWTVSGSLKLRGICPGCGSHSKLRHGWRHRRLQDFPAHGQVVTLDLRVGRWRCTSPDCHRRTFSDQFPSVARPHARRTSRTDQIVRHLGHAAGGRSAERLAQRLGIRVSDDSILRSLKLSASVAAPPPRVIGIDDWSWRKSTRYGTIIVDLERRSVVDVLEDRSVASCVKWLRAHPSVEVVSRDRCGIYAQAACEGAPQAVQIADRFHLIQNLRTSIERQMAMSGRMTGRALLSDKDYVGATSHLRSARLAHRQSRDDVFQTIHALREKGLSYCEIERQTGFKRRSVAKWLAQEVPPDRRRAALTPTSPWYFEEYLAKCWKDGNRRGKQLFHDVKQKGYKGSYSHLERLLASWRRADKANAQELPQTTPQFEPIKDPQTGHIISPVVAAALCIKPGGALSSEQVRKVEALKKGSQTFLVMRQLAMRFRGILRGRYSEPLDEWIDDAIETELVPMVRFASTLRRDIEAVRNAIELPWSNGQAEGQINRLKTLKRAMYGRAGHRLLKARMLPIHHTK